MTFGSIHLNARYSAVGVVVTCVALAPAANGSTKISGGRLMVENRSTSVFSSGETVTSWPPVVVVMRVNAPPSTGMV